MGTYIFWYYDILDRLIKQQNSALTKFYYDNNGNTVKTDFDGTITENTYNSRNMLIKTNTENMLITDYTYDPAGNVLTLNNSGISTAYEYNALGQMTKLTDNAGNSEVYT